MGNFSIKKDSTNYMRSKPLVYFDILMLKVRFMLAIGFSVIVFETIYLI